VKDAEIETSEKQMPFDMGIKKFKRLLDENPNLSKADKNKAIKAYKQRVYERVDEIKEKFKGIHIDGSKEKQAADLRLGGEQSVLRQPTEQIEANKSTD